MWFINALKVGCWAGAAFGALWYCVWIFRHGLPAGFSPKATSLTHIWLSFMAGAYVCDLMLESDPAKKLFPSSFYFSRWCWRSRSGNYERAVAIRALKDLRSEILRHDCLI
ncbi:MAG: hypothetical protein ACHP79_15815 [Terriglobales bacterium]